MMSATSSAGDWFGWWLAKARSRIARASRWTPAALAARLEAGILARTVLWLGELRQYADADGGAAVLGRLADLIVGEGRLLITTVWPEQWTTYTAAARAGPRAADPAGVAGRLLTRLPELTGHDPTRIDPARGGVIDVPARFTAAEMTSEARTGEPAPGRTGKSPSTWPGSLTCRTAMPGAAVTRTAGGHHRGDGPRERFTEPARLIRENHSYDVPDIVAMPILEEEC